MYQEHVAREQIRLGLPDGDATDQTVFISSLERSTVTLYAMEPKGETIYFKGLGRWPLPTVPQLLYDPNGFIADRFGGGKFKINFHCELTFVGTHNFRTFGEERWRQQEEADLD